MKTGTAPFCTIGATVVGKPAAQVITSSPGRRRLSAGSFGEVERAYGEQVRRRSRIRQDGALDPDRRGQLLAQRRRPAARA